MDDLKSAGIFRSAAANAGGRNFAILALGLLAALPSVGCTRKLYDTSLVRVYVDNVKEVIVGKDGSVAFMGTLEVKQNGNPKPDPRGTRYLIAKPEAMKALIELHTLGAEQTEMAPQNVVITKDIGPNWLLLPTGLGEKQAETDDLPIKRFESGTRHKSRGAGVPLVFTYPAGGKQMSINVDKALFEIRPLDHNKWYYKQLIIPAVAIDIVTYPFRIFF